MSQLDLPNQRVALEPELKDLLDYFKKSLKLEFNCHALGYVQTFYEEDQTADVQISYTKAVIQTDKNGVQTTGLITYPLLLSCPAVVLGGGGAYLTFPIRPHDECLILFNDRDIDNWFAGSLDSPPNTGRLHNMADGIALIGVRNLDCSILDYDINRATLRYKNAKIRTDGILIGLIGGPGGSLTLGQLLGNLNSELQTLTSQLTSMATTIAALTVTCAGPGNPSSVPINAAAFVTLGAAITTTGTAIGAIESQLEELLE